jgi:hypothetical protein
MDIKPLYTKEDYEEAINELMAYEARGFLVADELSYVEVMSELLEAFETKNDPEYWHQGCCK